MAENPIGDLLIEPKQQVALDAMKQFAGRPILILLRQEIRIYGISRNYILCLCEHQRQAAIEGASIDRLLVKRFQLPHHRWPGLQQRISIQLGCRYAGNCCHDQARALLYLVPINDFRHGDALAL